MAVRIEIAGFDKADEQLGKVELAMRGPAIRDAVKAAANVVARNARPRVPRSERTGTRDKWSKKTKAERAGVKPLANTIGVVVRVYENAVVAVTGPQLPAGALGHLVEDGHELVAWGHKTGKRVEGNEFMAPAVDETKGEQQAAFFGMLQQAIDKSVK